MGPRVKTVADALEVFEKFSAYVDERFEKQDAVNEKQNAVNGSVQQQIFDTRLEVKDVKSDTALVAQGVQEIKKLLEDKKMSWQFWVGIGIAAIPGIWGIISDILANKGV